MIIEQRAFYEAKLEYETDSWDLHMALQEGQQLVVVDTRSSEAYASEHIPGAINIQHRDVSQEALSTLDTAPLYVTYCDGIGCNAATKTAMKMLALGFRVNELIGGLDWWKRDGYATSGDNGQTGIEIERRVSGQPSRDVGSA